MYTYLSSTDSFDSTRLPTRYKIRPRYAFSPVLDLKLAANQDALVLRDEHSKERIGDTIKFDEIKSNVKKKKPHNDDRINENMVNDDEKDDDEARLQWLDKRDASVWRKVPPKSTSPPPRQTPITDLGVIKTPQDKKVKDEGFKKHAFNVLVSNRIGIRRSIPDTRHPLCKNQTYKSDLPSASVIICFYNEDIGTLMRTVHSVLDRTQSSHLKEILLVDDFSSEKEIKYNFMKYVYDKLPAKVKLIRTPDRSGLIRARLFGANHATGEILVFLDSHVEVNQGWLPPLLSRIEEQQRKVVVTPVIDIINANTFEYTASPIVRGGFNWGLHFKWDSVPSAMLKTKPDFIKPIPSPTMAGGLFAMDRKYFYALGSYDKGMDIWGGENLEMSFRIWTCGGRLEIMPCSRVGHVFRQRRPYGSPTGEDTLTKNSVRVAEVWMDDYKKYYYETRPDARGVPFGNIDDRVELRKKLNCTSFDWYLKNVYPTLKTPNPGEERERRRRKMDKLQAKIEARKHKRPGPYVRGRYQIQLAGKSKLCVESENEVTARGSNLILSKCMAIKRQLWSETDKAELRLADGLCLDGGDSGSATEPVLGKCHELGSGQEWKYSDRKNTAIYSPAAGMCLGTPGDEEPKVGQRIKLVICSSSGARKWDLISRGILFP